METCVVKKRKLDNECVDDCQKRCKRLQRGRIDAIVGPMFCGKTEELLRRVRRARHAKKKCLLVRFSHDNRYSTTGVASHADRVDDDCVSCVTAEEINTMAKDYDAIFVDEFTFFPGLTEYAKQWALNAKEVTCAGLDAFANRTLWPEFVAIVPWCDSLTKLTAICPICGEEASMTKDLISTDTNAKLIIGKSERYRASCRFCFDYEETSQASK